MEVEDIATSLAETGEAAVLKVSEWTGLESWQWTGVKGEPSVEEKGKQLILPGCGSFTIPLPPGDALAPPGAGVALECTVTSAVDDFSGGLVLSCDWQRVEITLLVSSSRAVLALREGSGALSVLAEREVTGALPKTLRLEVAGSSVTGMVGANENCLMVVGRCTLPSASPAMSMRCGILANGASEGFAAFSSFTVYLLAADRLVMGGGGGGFGVADLLAESSGAATGGKWTFSEDITSTERLDIQAMLQGGGFYVGAGGDATEGVGGDATEGVEAGGGSSQWTISTEISAGRRSEIEAFIAAQGAGRTLSEPAFVAPAPTEVPPATVSAGWRISASLSEEKRAQLMALIGSGE